MKYLLELVIFLLKRMLDKGLLIKVSKNVYWVMPFGQDSIKWHALISKRLL